MDNLKEKQVEPLKNEASFAAPIIDDLLGDHSVNTPVNKIEDDPFSGGRVADKSGASETFASSSKVAYEPFGISSMGYEVFINKTNHMTQVAFLIDGLSISGNDPTEKNTMKSDKVRNDSVIDVYAENQVSSSNGLNSEFASQAAGMNANSVYPLGSMRSSFPSGMISNPTLGSQHMNYSSLGTLYAQQYFFAAKANFHVGNLQSDSSSSGLGTKGGNSSPLPDIFNPGLAIQPPTSLPNGSKRDETKAFDFISDHLASARDTKRVI